MEGQMQFMKPPTPSNELGGGGGMPNLNMPPPTLSQPPPNLSIPPPNMPGAPGQGQGGGNFNPRFGNQQFQPRQFFRAFQPFVPRGPIGPMTLEDFDGKRLRKSVMRKTVDYNSAIIEALETRVWQRDYRDRRALQPDVMYYPELLPPPSYPDNAINCVTTRFVKTATNKMRCPIFCMAWTPEGRRLVTGASSGEFTLWNGLTFNFETILQAHDSPVRTMVWSHNDNWMVTGDHAGYVKYWQSNMNNVKMFQAHKEALRGISFSPSDSKFVTCSDDGTLRIWDFLHCHEEHVLRGHGADVKCVQWHPQKSLIISGSKDNQQPIKLWDPKTGQSLATLHAHKSTVMDLKWNENGNWLITASRDHLLKLFDLRNLNQEVQTFRGHKKEASSVAWHPYHEGLFASGGSDGSIMFWHVGADKEVGAIEQAHDSIVWTLAWHPLGHILCSGSNDHSSKFWTRNRPGDMMRDKYNLNTLPAGLSGLEDVDADEPSVIPGMGPEDKVEITMPSDSSNMTIPGLDLDAPPANAEDKPNKTKKVPYSKPIPRNFQAQWNDTEDDGPRDTTISEVISHIVENTPGVVPLEKITPSAIIVYGKVLPVEPGSVLEKKIAEGPEALKRYIASGAIEELHDVMPHEEDDDYLNDDDDTSTVPKTLTDVVLPTPLPSSKLNLAALTGALTKPITQQSSDQQSQDKNKSERPRKSRFSDINDTSEKTELSNLTTPFSLSQLPLNSLDNMRPLNTMNNNSPLNSNINNAPASDPSRIKDQDYRDQDFRDQDYRSRDSDFPQNKDYDYREQPNRDQDFRDQDFRDPDQRYRQGMYQPESNSYDNEIDEAYDEERDVESPKRPRFDNFRGDNADDAWQFRNWDGNNDGNNMNFNNHANGNMNFANQGDNFGRSNNFAQGGAGGNMFRSGGPNYNNRPPFGNQSNFRNDGPPSGPPSGGGGGWGNGPPPMRNNDNFRGGNRGGFRGHRGGRRGGRGGASRGGPQRGRNTFN